MRGGSIVFAIIGMIFLLCGRLDTQAAGNTHPVEITLDRISGTELSGDET